MIAEVFQYETSEVRVLEHEGQPCFVAKDVCKILGISNSRDALALLEEDEKDGVGITDTIGRSQQTSVVFESGLFALIFKSRKSEAKKFRKWVTSEVLPSIRKTGSYSLAKPPDPPSRLDLAKMVIDLEKEREALEPDAKYGRELQDSDDLFTINQVAKPLGSSAISLNRFLCAEQVIYKQSGDWMPYAKYQDKGFFRIIAIRREVLSSEGALESKVFHQLKITPKGRAFVHKLWRDCHSLAVAN